MDETVQAIFESAQIIDPNQNENVRSQTLNYGHINQNQIESQSIEKVGEDKQDINLINTKSEQCQPAQLNENDDADVTLIILDDTINNSGNNNAEENNENNTTYDEDDVSKRKQPKLPEGYEEFSKSIISLNRKVEPGKPSFTINTKTGSMLITAKTDEDIKKIKNGYLIHKEMLLKAVLKTEMDKNQDEKISEIMAVDMNVNNNQKNDYLTEKNASNGDEINNPADLNKNLEIENYADAKMEAKQISPDDSLSKIESGEKVNEVN